MKKIKLSDLHMYDFAITDISVIYHSPTWNCIGDKNDSRRQLNGFLLIDKGACVYEWDDKRVSLEHGGLIYVGTGAKRRVTVSQRPLSMYRICFRIYDIKDGEEIVFDDVPWVVTTDSSQLLYDICDEMRKSSLSRTRLYKTTSLMYEFLHIIGKSVRMADGGKISPAIDWLDRHFAEDIDIDTLAEKCFMSKSHFFRLFKDETGFSPIEYRNNLRIERAKILLSDGECSVTETALMLGFENVYYFSRMFKKITGMSPTGYEGK